MQPVAITLSEDKYLKKYADWLAEAGFAAERIDSVDALERYPLLVLSGGGDMAPGSGAFRGDVDETRLRNPKPERDALELALLAAARERQMPVLGICRGLQVLNVACGGTLWPDISDGGFETAAHTGGTRDTDDVYHPVTMSGVEFEVTSHHHEGVRDLGEGLEVISSPNGLAAGRRARNVESCWTARRWRQRYGKRAAVRAAPVQAAARPSRRSRSPLMTCSRAWTRKTGCRKARRKSRAKMVVRQAIRTAT